MPTLKKAALFSTSFVPYSQTFIYTELIHHSRYELDVFTKSYTNTAIFPFPRVYYPPNRLAQSFYLNRTWWPGFDKHFKKNNYTLIHAQFGTSAVYAMHYKRKYKLPLIVTFQGMDVSLLIGKHFKGFDKMRYVKRSKQILQEADKILCVSTELAEILKDISGRDDISVHKHGIDTTKFTPKTLYPTLEDRPLNLLLVGRFTQKKGHIYAIRAVEQLVKQNYKIQLRFIGGGELEASLIDYVQNRGLDNNIHFLGIKFTDEVRKYMAESDIVLVPSIVADNFDREGSPVVVKEAFASGIPVIGTYHAGISETIEDGKTGFLVPERYVDTLAQKIQTFYHQPHLIEEFGKNARIAAVQNYDIRKQVDELELFYDSILK